MTITAGDLMPAYLPIEEDPIAAALEREDEYWRSIGGRDPEPTYKAGWKERWEKTEEPR